MAGKDGDKGAKARKAERMLAALEYKKAGATERFIAERLGISKTSVHNYITEALGELKKQSLQNVEEMRTLEGARIDQGRFAIAAKVVRGELDALDRWLKASSEYRKLYGLDVSPKQQPIEHRLEHRHEGKVDLNVKPDFDHDGFREVAARLFGFAGSESTPESLHPADADAQAGDVSDGGVS
jgi:predicted transcriptional regulator